ncbi:hypothetical protein [Enterococcus phage PEF1]
MYNSYCLLSITFFKFFIYFFVPPFFNCLYYIMPIV